MLNTKFGINPLALLAGILLSISLIFPWWSLEVSVMNRPTFIYPYLIDGPASEIVGYQRSPQMAILFYLLLVCLGLFFTGSFLRNKVLKITSITAGVLVGLAIWRFLDRIAGVAALYEVPIQGHGIGSYGGFAFVDVYTVIQPGLYLASISAVLGILAGLFHQKLSTKFRINWVTNDAYITEEESS